MPVVRIFGGEAPETASFRGTAILITSRLFLTCAHVVWRNLHGRKWETQDAKDFEPLPALSVATGSAAKPIPASIVWHHDLYDVAVGEMAEDISDLEPFTVLEGFDREVGHQLIKAGLFVHGFHEDNAEPYVSGPVTLVGDFHGDGSVVHEIQIEGGVPEGVSGGALVLHQGPKAICVGLAYLGSRGSATSRAYASARWIDPLTKRWPAVRVSSPTALRSVLHPPLWEVPDLPADFVDRPELLAELEAAVLGNPQGTSGITAALRGAGGYGKTGLAIALVHRARVRASFPDGTIWITLGQKEGVALDGLRRLYRALAETTADFTEVDEGVRRVRKVLAERRFLLVIDDAWRKSDVDAFIACSPHCARVVTTRSESTLPSGASVVKVGRMESSEAYALLAAGLDPTDECLPLLHEMAEHDLCRWVLLLKLANGYMRELVTINGAMAMTAITQARELYTAKGPTAFDDRDEKAREKAVELTMAASLSILAAHERTRCLELGIFPQDVDIPVSVVERLWAKTGYARAAEARDLCKRLHRLAVVDRYDIAQGVIRLHDTIAKYLQDELGDSRASAHTFLLQACRPPSGWAALTKADQYLWRFVPWHLAQAKDSGELRALLHDFAWLDSKIRVMHVTSLFEDFALPEIVRDPSIAVIGRALRLSSHAIATHPALLASQLHGRLMYSTDAAIELLLSEARRLTPRPWCLPRRRCLSTPHTALLQTILTDRPVTCVVMMLNGKRALSGFDDGTLRLWDLEKGVPVGAPFRGDAKSVSCLAVMEDGTVAISGSSDGTLRVWDLKGREPIGKRLAGHDARVSSVAVMQDGKRAISGSADKTLRIWDLEKKIQSGNPLQGSDAVNCVAVMEDGTRAISGSVDRTLWVWDLERRVAIGQPIDGHERQVSCVAVANGDTRAISGSADGTVSQWDLKTGTRVGVPFRHSGGRGVMSVALNEDGTRAIAASKDGLRIWDLRTATIVGEQLRHLGVVSVAMARDGTRAISGARDGLRMWDLTRAASTNEERSPGRVLGLAVVDGRPTMISDPNDGSLILSDVETGAKIGKPLYLGGRNVSVQVAFTADAKRVVLGFADGSLSLYDFGVGAAPIGDQRIADNRTSSAIIAQDGRRIVHSLRRSIRHATKDTVSGDDAVYSYHGGTEITSIAVTKDGARAISGSRAGALKFWDFRARVHVAESSGHRRMVTCIAIMDGGNRAISGSFDGSLRLWDVERGIPIGEPLMEHSEPVTCVAVTEDGTRAISGSSGQTVRIWDLTARTPIGEPIRGHKDVVSCVVMIDGGRRAISGSADCTLRLWDVVGGTNAIIWWGDQPITHLASCFQDRVILVGEETGASYELQLE